MNHKRLLLFIMIFSLCLFGRNTYVFAQDEDTGTDICSTFEEAAEILREGMKERKNEVEISYAGDYILGSADFTEIADLAMEHTGNPTEGDYLRFQYAQWNAKAVSTSGSKGNYRTDFIFYDLSYYTTAEQEEEMNTAVSLLLSDLNLEGKSDAEKISIIYDYICSNVSYDSENLDDTAYTLKYTAYAALENKTAVCQGYAVLLYRLLLEEGIDVRVISGTLGNIKHSWNIVKIGDCYYNMDCTWDAAYKQRWEKYQFLLKCDDNFQYHTRNEKYTCDTFENAYPMGTEDYWDEGTFIKKISCMEEWTCVYAHDDGSDDSFTEVFPAIGYHTEVTDEAVDATCTNSGLTEGSHCSVCGMILKEQTKIPAFGHSFTSYTPNGDASYVSNGTETALCDNGCGTTNTREISGTMKKLTATSVSSICNNSSGVKLCWKKVTGASGYYIYRKASGTADYKKIKSISGNSTVSFTDTGAANGTKYYYRIIAYNSAQKVVSKTAAMVRISVISVSKLSNLSGRKISLTWRKNSKVTGYQIIYATGSSFKNAKKITISSCKNLSRTIKGLVKGKTYYVKIRGFKIAGSNKYYGGYSSAKKIKITK